jgi:glycosyltransferase involved in cell wall biosynthesis
MKLLFVTEFFPADKNLIFTGGVEAYNYFLIQELSRKNQVTVICRNVPNISERRKDNFKIVRAGFPADRIDTGLTTIFGRLIFMLDCIRIGLNQEFDIVQGNNFVTYLPAFIIGWLKRKPKLAWYPDVFIGRWIRLTGFGSGLVGEITERISLKLSWEKFIALSLSTKEKLIKRGVKENNIVTIYGGVNSDFFRGVKEKKDKKFKICCISRLVSYKNIDVLIKAVKVIKEKNIDFNLIIIGDGPERNNLFNLIRKLNLENQIKIKSNLSRLSLAKQLKSSKIFCLPSSEEGFGLVILEALAAGIPYIVSDIPVLREITQNGKGGLFFKEKKPKELAKMILRLAKNKKLRNHLSNEGRILLNSYSWESIAQQFQDVYSQFKSSIRILMLVDAWFPHYGGGQVHVWELSKQLAQKGCQVTIFTRNLGYWEEYSKNISVVKAGHFLKFANLLGRLEYLVLALLFSLRFQYDILHAHAFSPGLLVPLVSFFRHKPTVFTVHGKGDKIAGIPIRLNILENLVLYKIKYDTLISVAKNTITKPVTSKRMVIIPNGVNLSDFVGAQRVRERVKNIIYVGRLSYEKGVDRLIEAMITLNRVINLYIIGEGQEADNLKKIANGKKIFFTGKLFGKPLINYYRKADLLVLPSRTEGSPLVLFEAWAAGVPILATKVGDNSRYIKNNINGFLVESSVMAIKRALETIIQRKDLKKISERGYKSATKYSWDSISNKTLKIYQDLINE